MINTEKLTHFFAGLQSGMEAHKSVRRVYNQKMAFDFNSVDFFWPGENKVSELLAFFLNPNETHGQGCVFLDAFLEYLGVSSDLISEGLRKNANVELEHPTDENRRIDLTIEFGNGDYWIGIENKVGTAIDQKDQVSHYADYLEAKSGGHYKLYYLTPHGDDPSNISISVDKKQALVVSNKLGNLSYTYDIVEMLHRFESQCQADNVRSFIRDLNSHIKKRFIGEVAMSEMKYIEEFVGHSPERQRLALEVINSKNAIFESLVASLTLEIENYCKKQGFQVEEIITSASQVLNSKAYYQPLVISKSGWNGAKICFEFQSRGGNNLALGLIKENSQKAYEEARMRLNFKHSNDCWALWDYVDQSVKDWGRRTDAWKEMIKPEVAEESPMMDRLRTYIEALATEIDKVELDK